MLRGCLSFGRGARGIRPGVLAGQLPHLALGGLQFLGQSPFLGLSVLPRGFFRYSVLTASVDLRTQSAALAGQGFGNRLVA